MYAEWCIWFNTPMRPGFESPGGILVSPQRESANSFRVAQKRDLHWSTGVRVPGLAINR
jgi:hypothetical protein